VLTVALHSAAVIPDLFGLGGPSSVQFVRRKECHISFARLYPGPLLFKPPDHLS
jgi:hypothetical protein